MRESVGRNSADLWAGIDFYNADYSAYGNEVYGRVETRLAHWINFQRDDWFARRLEWPLASAGRFDAVLDLGFSVPYAYSRPELLRGNSPRWILVDKEASAVQFYDILTRILDAPPLTMRRDRVLQLDVEDAASHATIIASICEIKPSSILVVASELIEHLREQDIFWQLIARISTFVPKSYLYLTLPVGKRIPSHELEFLSDVDAARFASAHLAIDCDFTIKPPNNIPVSPYLQGCYCAVGTMKPLPDERTI